MPLFLYKCDKCNATKKHFFSTESKKVVSCPKCGNSESYNRTFGNFNSQVKYNTLDEIFEHEITPFVNDTWTKMGRELVNGDIKTLENFYGEDKLKETFYENDTWIDPDQID